MIEGSYEQRAGRAKELLKTVRHAAIATVNADGSPHNSPVFSTWDDDLNFYWASGKDTQHSQNIQRDPRVFVVLFDSMDKGGGLYMQGEARVLEGAELPEALEVVNVQRTALGRAPLTTEYFSGGNPNRLYKAIRRTTWVNVTERDGQGLVTREYRREVTPRDLLQ